jgi:hypothetical protein
MAVCQARPLAFRKGSGAASSYLALHRHSPSRSLRTDAEQCSAARHSAVRPQFDFCSYSICITNDFRISVSFMLQSNSQPQASQSGPELRELAVLHTDRSSSKQSAGLGPVRSSSELLVLHLPSLSAVKRIFLSGTTGHSHVGATTPIDALTTEFWLDKVRTH